MGQLGVSYDVMSAHVSTQICIKAYPVSGANTPGASSSNLTTQLGQHSVVELAVLWPAERLIEASTCDGRDILGDVHVGSGIQSGQRSIVEVVAVGLVLDLVQGCVSSSNDSNSSVSDSRAVVLGEPTSLAERLESANNIRPGGVAIGLDINKQVKSLAGRCIENTVVSGRSHKGRAWVLLLENREDGLNVERVECASVSECRLLVSNLWSVSRDSSKYS